MELTNFSVQLCKNPRRTQMSNNKVVRSTLVLIAVSVMFAACGKSNNSPSPSATGLRPDAGQLAPAKVTVAPIATKMIRDAQGHDSTLVNAPGLPAGFADIDRVMITRTSVALADGSIGTKWNFDVATSAASLIKFVGTDPSALAVDGRSADVSGATLKLNGDQIVMLAIHMNDGRSLLLNFGAETALPSDQAGRDPAVGQPSQDQSQPKQDQPKQDQPKQDQPKQDQPKQDQPKQDQPKQDQPKQDQPKQDQPKQDQPKQDQPKQDQPKQDQPKQDQPKQDQPKQDQPKQDQPKQDQPKQDQPKQDMPKI
jgi:hypothetical protein